MLHFADYRGRNRAAALAAFLLLALCLLAAGAQAEPAAGAVPITNSTVITAPGTYYLAESLADLDCPVAISIRSPDVAFDGLDRLIGGQDLAGSIGIEIRPPDGGPALTNVSVANVRLADWETGLTVSPASTEIPATGVRLTGVSAADNGAGFRLWGPGNLTLEGCTAESNERYGIRADGITGDLTLALTDVLVQANGETGIDARLTGITMNTCRIRENGGEGGFRFDKGFAIVRDSLFEQNRGAGIFLEYATNGTITGSTIRYNGIGIRDANSAGEGTVNVYDNYFLNERNVALDSQVDTWSVPKRAGPNIAGGPFIGGNYWAALNGTGFSQTHPDTDGDGFCDEPYPVTEDAVDYLPLARTNGTPTPTPTPPFGGVPYRPLSVPGRIQAEDYNLGGQYVAYSDTTPGNTGGAYRADDVDIETAGGITNVGWIRDGEYLTYTVNVSRSGPYLISLRVATPNSGRTVEVSADGERPITYRLPNTGSFTTYATATLGSTPCPNTWMTVTQTPMPMATGIENQRIPIHLSGGTHVIKLAFHGDGQNLDWIEIAPETPTTPTPTPMPYKPLAIPGTIQAEDYDLGGEGVAYHDTTTGNSGSAYRSDGVDIETIGGTTAVGWIRNGEWLGYTVNVTQAGSYLVTARVASPNTERGVTLWVDGNQMVTLEVPDTGSFETFAPAIVPVNHEDGWSYPVSVVLSAGTHTLKLLFSGDGQNLDWLAFAPAPPITPPTPEPYVNVTLPATIQAEDYDLGGENVAYYDTTAGNSGGAYRQDDVDVAAIAGGHAVVGIEDGEWLVYTIDGMAPSGNEPAALILHLASDRDGGRVQVEINGRVAGNVSVPNTGSATVFRPVQTQVVAAKGTLRLLFRGGGMSMDRIESPWTIIYPERFPMPNFTADRTNGTAPLTVRFTDTSSEFAYDWHWTFGDGATSTEQNPVHTFRSPGVYPVNLTIREYNYWDGSARVHVWDDPMRYPKTVNVTVEGTGPNSGLALPGRIQAEDYNAGGEGVAYHDTTAGNSGGAYRHDDVDIEAANGITNVGWIRNGEWLAYTAAVQAAGTYTVTASVASPYSGRTIVLLLNDVPIATIAVPNTGSFSRFATVTAPLPVMLPAGIHTLKLAFAGDGQNIDLFAIGCNCPAPPTSPMPSGGASFTAAPATAPYGGAVKFTVTPSAGRTISAAWWSFDAPAHLNTWNSRATNPTFFYPQRGTFSPLVKLTYTDGSTETVQRTNYVRAT